MNAMHLQAMDIIPTIPDAMMEEVIDYLSAARDRGGKYEKPFAEEKELDLSGLPKSVNADKMTDEELVALLKAGIEKVLAGERGIQIEEFAREFRARQDDEPISPRPPKLDFSKYVRKGSIPLGKDAQEWVAELRSNDRI